MSSDPNPNPKAVTDETSFLAFVRELAADQRLAVNLEEQEPDRYGAPRGWQNATIEQFLEAAVAWGRGFGLRAATGAWSRGLAVASPCSISVRWKDLRVKVMRSNRALQRTIRLPRFARAAGRR